MGDYGLKVSEPGYSVLTANIENIIFSSACSFFKVYYDGTSNLTIPASATSSSLTFNHSLGYVPAFLMYSTAFTGDSYGRPIPRGKSPDPIFAAPYASSSSIKFLIKLDGTKPQFTITVRCIIFYDRVS